MRINVTTWDSGEMRIKPAGGLWTFVEIISSMGIAMLSRTLTRMDAPTESPARMTFSADVWARRYAYTRAICWSQVG